MWLGIAILRWQAMNIDWQMLALNIQQKQSLAKASYKNRLNKGYLSQLARGEITEPRFSIGVKLLDYHFDVCGVDKHKRLTSKIL